MTTPDLNKQLIDLIERERVILKKLSIARRAGSSENIIGQITYMLDEIRFAQQDTRALQSANTGKDDGFNSFISIG